MNVHETYEDLSAYLDGELGDDARARIEAHLAACVECSSRKQALETVSRAVAALPDVHPAPGDSRALRLAVIESRRPRRFAPRAPRAPRAWALAGGVALVVFGIAGAGILTRGGGEPKEVGAGRATELADEPPLVFDSEDEVRKTVLSLPKVKEGTEQFTVADVGERQSEELAALGPGGDAESAPIGATSSDSSRSTEMAAGASRPGVPLVHCATIILRSQPYSMMPVLGRRATFRNSPAYLLVFAWTQSSAASARLDRLQVWLVDPGNCSPDAPLFLYTVFRP